MKNGKFYAKLVFDNIDFIFLESLEISPNFITILYTSYNFRNMDLFKLFIGMKHFQFFFSIIIVIKKFYLVKKI